MRITVIPEDRWIRRDQQAAYLPDWNFDDDNIHAIQWLDGSGEIEFKGDPRPANEPFTDQSILEPYLNALDDYLQSTP